MGRPTTLKPELTAKICAHLEIAVPFKYACEAEGVPERTAFEWMERGEKGEQPFAEFSAAVTRARGQAAVQLSKLALSGAKGSQTAAWLLERRYRGDYATRSEHSGPEGSPIKTESVLEHKFAQLSVEELRELARGLRGS